MAVSQTANLAEKAMGHTGDATTIQNVTNPAQERSKYADPSGETMKALCWMGKNDVRVCKLDRNPTTDYSVTWANRVCFTPVDTPKPALIEDRDVILKVTGSTICGSDLHLMHGQLPQLASVKSLC